MKNLGKLVWSVLFFYKITYLISMYLYFSCICTISEFCYLIERKYYFRSFSFPQLNLHFIVLSLSLFFINVLKYMYDVILISIWYK